ncbi:MAG: hypothetical protein QT02_C0004G0001 [archaeon GW2011_AR9]|nr:MAG: hypothetical protein QT02_C0004G0001 [archaeon GW2011_AR9]
MALTDTPGLARVVVQNRHLYFARQPIHSSFRVGRAESADLYPSY